VRKHTCNPEPADSRLSSQSPDTTKQKELAWQLSSIIKEHRERSVSTGNGHTLRWQPGRKPATHSEGVMQPPELTGNALNAAEVANAQAKKVSNLRSPPSLQVMTNFILATYTTHTSYEEIQAACRARERPCFRIDTSPGRRSFWTRPYFIRERGNGWTRQVIIFWDTRHRTKLSAVHMLINLHWQIRYWCDVSGARNPSVFAIFAACFGIHGMDCESDKFWRLTCVAASSH
jgi:hypothetical protein